MQGHEFHQILAAHMGLQLHADKNSLLLGAWQGGEASLPAIEAAMQAWTSFIDSHLHKAERGSALYIQLMAMRGCSFREWLLLFSTQLSAREYRTLPVFEYFLIQDSKDRDLYLLNKETDVHSYLEAIRASTSPVATFFSTELPYHITLPDLKRHLHFVAKSGSGKTEVLKTLFYSLQAISHKKRQHSLVLIEPHGEFAGQAARFDLNASARERLVYIDPYLDKSQERVPILNPFDMLPLRNEQDIDTLTQQLVIAFGEISADTDFSDRMKGILRATIGTLLRRPGSTFVDLMRFMQNDPELIALGKQSPNAIHRELFAQAFTSGEYENTKKAIYSKLYGLLSTAGFAKVMIGQSTINLQEAMDSGKIIIINLSKGELGDEASQALGCFIIALLRAITFKRAQIPEHHRKPCFLFIDEMQNYVSQSMDVILSESRKYGLHLILVHQYLTQVESKRLKDAILANTAIKIVGETNEASIKAMAVEMRTESAQIRDLPKYHFVIKTGSREAMTIRSSSHLLFDAYSPSSYYQTHASFSLQKERLLFDSGYYAVQSQDLVPDAWAAHNAPAENRFHSSKKQDASPQQMTAPKPKFSL